MSSDPKSRKDRHRIGVMLGPVGKLKLAPTQYLILQLNHVQDIFEFELIPAPTVDPLWDVLNTDGGIDRHLVESELERLPERYAEEWNRQLESAIACESPPEFIIIISLARFEDGLYSTTVGKTATLALGNWKKYMAPPSLVEFIVILTLRLAIGLVEPAVRPWSHLGTKGCLWDFNPTLSGVRYKVLVGYLCPECEAALRKKGLSSLADQLPKILSRSWLGRRDDPQSPASVAAKLGYDLFVTQGARPSARDRIVTLLEEEAIKEALKWFLTLLLAATLVWLGLKNP